MRRHCDVTSINCSINGLMDVYLHAAKLVGRSGLVGTRRRKILSKAGKALLEVCYPSSCEECHSTRDMYETLVLQELVLLRRDTREGPRRKSSPS